MRQIAKTFKRIPQATLRRLRSTPTYFFLIWRWGTWLYAFAWYLSLHTPINTVLIPLIVTFVQVLAVTLYAPVFKVFLPRLPRLNFRGGQSRRLSARRQRRLIKNSQVPVLAVDEEASIFRPLVETPNSYWNMAIYALDVIICGLVMYFSAADANPPFGDGSPFYRYGLSSILIAGFTYRYTGGLLAALGYSLFVVFGAFFPPPGQHRPYAIFQNPQDLVGSLIDAPLVALLSAYMSTLLNNYMRTKRREQDHARRERYLREVSNSFVSPVSDRLQLLQQRIKDIRRGGHFERVLITLVLHEEGEAPSADPDAQIQAGLIDEHIPDTSAELIAQVIHTGKKSITFEPIGEEERYGIARLYQPFYKDGQAYLVIGAESTRQTPFDQMQEDFLAIIGAQLVIVLENIRLTEQTAELAAAAERSRIAREIHDGVAQLIYMLSLNSETCAALVERVADSSEEDAQALAPVSERLEKLVMLSKQALWETRHYMFSLKPLILGTTTLTQMLNNQLREFEAISGLSTHLEVVGNEEMPNGGQQEARRIAQVGTAVFRITQEALSNAYKHAGASEISVYLRHRPGGIEVEISDDGKGLQAATQSDDPGANSTDGTRPMPIYSGHGMRGMRERAEELGGTFEVWPGATHGTHVMVRIPI